MPNYARVLESLPGMLIPVSEALRADAAVALLLEPTDRDLKVLLVKRVETHSDPWSGQMALPGGKRDPKDKDAKQTIVRETLEETNINLLDRCRFLGVMDPLTSTPRPEMRIIPFVVLLEHEPSIRLSGELEEFVWVSLEELERHNRTVNFSFGKQPAYVIGDYPVWGLTYRILKKFFQILKNSSKDRLHTQRGKETKKQVYFDVSPKL